MLSRFDKVKIGTLSIGFTKLENLNLDVSEELVGQAGSLTPPTSRAMPPLLGVLYSTSIIKDFRNGRNRTSPGPA